MKRSNKVWERILAAMLVFILTVSGLSMPVPQVSAAAAGTIYYVSNDGDDGNSGTAEEASWQTLDKVNSVTFKPGDQLLFKSGDEWIGQLAPKGSGNKENPIVIGKYGGETRPLIQGNGLVEGDDTNPVHPKPYNATLQFYNQQYWEITSLEITNYSEEKSTWKTYNSSSQIITQTDKIPSKYGILIIAKDNGVTRHMHIKDCDIHDVNGDTLINRGAGIGRGAIVYMIRGKDIETSWDDILVEGNSIGRPDDGRQDPEGNHAANITSYGVSFVSTWCGTVFPHESGIPATERAGGTKYSTNLVFRNNYFVDVGNAAICPSGYENAILENNVSDRCNSGVNGNVPFWWQLGTNTIAQYNEVFGTGAAAAKEDSQAFDADLGATENYIQYNYTHDNPSGSYFECAIGSVFNTHYRYNISQNDGDGYNSHGKGAVIAIGGSSTNAASRLYVYNNDMVIGSEHIGLIANSWEHIGPQKKQNYRFENNLMYSDGASGTPIGGKNGGTVVKGWEDRFYEGSTLSHNYYGGTDLAAIDRGASDDPANVNVDENPVYGDVSEEIPELKTAYQKDINAATGWDNTELYKRAAVDNPILQGAGKVIPDNGGLDFFGNYVSPFAAPSIGAHETQTSFSVPDGVTMISFDGAAAGPVAESDLGGLSLAGKWRVSDQEEIYLNSSSASDKSARFEIPEGYALYGFSARTDGGSAIVRADDGISEKSFYLSSVKNSYLLNGTEGNSSRSIYLTVEAPDGAAQVKFDNLILVPSQDSVEKNVALDKPATQNRGYNSAALANDGDVNTMGGNTGTFPYIWTVDLKDKFRISRAEIEWEDLYSGEKKGDPSTWGENVAEDWKYKVSYSDDGGSTWKILWDYSTGNPNTDPAASVIQGLDTDIGATHFQVEIISAPTGKSSAWAVLPEFRAFGSKWYENVALGQAAGQNLGSDAPKPADNAVDGDPESLAGGRSTAYLPYVWYVDLGQTYRIGSAEVIWEDIAGDKDWKYKIECGSERADQDDKSAEWLVLADYTQENSNKQAAQLSEAPPGMTGRYIRITVTGKASANPSACYLGEVRVFGEAAQPQPVNAALGKTATQNRGSNAAALAVDDDINTFAGNTGSYPYQWMVDLGSDIDVAAAETYWQDVAEKAEDVKYKVEYALSDATPALEDDQGWQMYADYTAASPYAGNPETSRIQTIRNPVTARYFRVTITGAPSGTSWWAALREFRAYTDSEPEPSGELDLDNLAYGKPVKATVNQDDAEQITDGSRETSWQSAASGDYVRIDLGLKYQLEDLALSFGSAPGSFTVSVSEDGSEYTDIWDFADGGNSSKELAVETDGENVRYIKVTTGDAVTDLRMITAHGEELAETGKTILIAAPHPDDEVLLGGGVIHRAINNGNEVYVLLGTLGDYNSTSSGKARMKESINALQNLGVPLDHMIFMGYGDRGGLKQFGQSYTDGMLYRLYTAADPDEVIASRQGHQTYGGAVDSWRMKLHGEESDYTRNNFLSDIEAALELYRPDEIYTTSRFDLHSDHAVIGIFIGDAVINVRKNDSSYKPKVYETMIHSCEGDSGNGGGGSWPDLNSDSVGMTAHRVPKNLEHTPDQWCDRVSFTVPEAMLVTPFDRNLKNETLKKYTSQYFNYIGAFAKFDEFFWERDYSGIAYFADTSASSEDHTGGAAAAKAVDGIRDGYSDSLTDIYGKSATPLADHYRFPFAEWVAAGDTDEELTLEWERAYDISRVLLYDRPDLTQNITAAEIEFRRHDTVLGTAAVSALPEDGQAYEVDLSSVDTSQVTALTLKITGTDGTTSQTGLAELEVYGEPVKIAPDLELFTYSTVEDEETGELILTPAVYSGQANPYPVTAGPGVGAITVKYDGAAKVPTVPGSYTVTVDTAEGTEYLAVTDLEIGEYTIKKAPLTITADSINHEKDQALPELAYTVTGIVSGETAADALSEEPELSCEADGTEIGEFPITVSGGTAGANYEIAGYVPGTLTVSYTPLTGNLVIEPGEPRIGDTLEALLSDSNYTGELEYTWKAGEENLATGSSYTVTAADLGKNLTVTLTSTLESGQLVSNPTEAVKKALTETDRLVYETDDTGLKAVVYNGRPQPYAVSAGADNGAGAVTAVYYDGSTEIPKDAGSYTVTVDVAEGTECEAVSGLELGSYTIERAPLTLTALGAAMTVNEPLPAFTCNISGIAPGETRADALEEEPLLSSAANGKTAGTYKIDITGGKETANYQIKNRISGALQVITDTHLTGQIKITPASPKPGTLVSASLTRTNSAGNLTYLWQVDGVHVGTGANYLVEAADAGKQLSVTVYASDCAGQLNAAVTVGKADSGKDEEPVKEAAVPTSVKAAQSSAENAKITWSKSANAKSYVIYRSAKRSGGYKKTGTATAASYTDKKAKAGKTWYYKVAAVSADGKESNLSAVTQVAMLKVVKPKVRSAAKGQIKVTWKRVKGAAGYQVRIASSRRGKLKSAATLKKGSKVKVVLKKKKSRKTYYITVRAYRKVNGKKVYGKESKRYKVKVK